MGDSLSYLDNLLTLVIFSSGVYADVARGKGISFWPQP